MSLLLLLPLLVSLSTYVLYTYIIHPLVFSPLRRIPSAFPGSSVTPLWISFYRRKGSQGLGAITRAHALHGPVVRISPNEISVSSYEGAKKVYVERGGFAKPKWWAELFTTYGVNNMVSMQGGHGNKDHAARKRDMGNVYVKSFLLGNKVLSKVTERVLDDLRQALRLSIQEGGVLNVYNFLGGASADFTSAYIYGLDNSTMFLRDRKFLNSYYQNHDTWLKGKPGAIEAQRWLENFGMQRRIAAEIASKDAGTDGIVYNQLASKGIRDARLTSELLDHFIAGAEGTRTALTYLAWELSKCPLVRERLAAELQSFWKDSAHAVPDLRALDVLPLLDAVLNETLRLYTPTPGPQHRIVPPEGTTMDGIFIPGGVQISSSFGILHQNPDVFSDPHDWNPDRWLTADKDKLDEMRRWFWAFSKGSRMCIGKDFATIVMKLIIATVYSQYETEVVEDDGMEQEDLFLAGPIGEKLVLKFKYIQ